jgi:prevent-host-death family protein
MKLAGRIKPITQLKNNTAEMIREVAESRQPIVITQNGEAKAVLMDVATFDSWRDALLILKLLAPGMNEFAAGQGVPHDEAFAEIRRALDRVKRER